MFLNESQNKTTWLSIVYPFLLEWQAQVFKNYYFLRTWESRDGNEMCSHAPISVLPCWSQHIIAQTEVSAEMQACQRLTQGLSQRCALLFEESSLWWLFKQLLGYLFPNSLSPSGRLLSLWRHKHYFGRFFPGNSLLSLKFFVNYFLKNFLGCFLYIHIIWITTYTPYPHYQTRLSFSLQLD